MRAEVAMLARINLRLRQLASTTDDYEEQIALAAALRSLKFLKERSVTRQSCNHSSGDFLITSTTIPRRCSKLHSFFGTS
jgi:hypothetical protein